jgi:DUF1009 family protein
MNAVENKQNIAIIVGKGELPKELAMGLKAVGNPAFLVGIEEEYQAWVTHEHHKILHWGQFGALFKLLKELEITQVIFAGSVTRPNVSFAKMDWGAITSLPQILAFMIGGDNTLLSGLIRLFEKKGIQIVGPHEVLPELLADTGKMTKLKPSRKANTNITTAFKACKMLGELDIGQAAVAVGGRVIAVEGIEGTDNMLERVAYLRSIGRLYENGRNGVLVKCMKPNQEMRADLPAIGIDTIRNVAAAGLAGIAIEGGRSIILSREETIAAANESELFIYGAQFDGDK